MGSLEVGEIHSDQDTGVYHLVSEYGAIAYLERKSCWEGHLGRTTILYGRT